MGGSRVKAITLGSGLALLLGVMIGAPAITAAPLAGRPKATFTDGLLNDVDSLNPFTVRPDRAPGWPVPPAESEPALLGQCPEDRRVGLPGLRQCRGRGPGPDSGGGRFADNLDAAVWPSLRNVPGIKISAGTFSGFDELAFNTGAALNDGSPHRRRQPGAEEQESPPSIEFRD